MAEKFDYMAVIDKYYPAGCPARGILLTHSRNVANLALEIAACNKLPLDPEEIETAAMLHDIGIVETDASGIGCFGTEPYLRHGVIGARMLRQAGAPEIYADVCERHTGAGLTAEEVRSFGLPLDSERDYMPRTLLERLICYADCFYSKTRSDERKTLERVRAGMARHGETILHRFDALHREFSTKEE